MHAAILIEDTLRNGTPVTIRSLREDDRARIAQAIRGLDRDSIYMRLFAYRGELTEAGLDRVMRVGLDDLVLVVTVGKGSGEEVVGSGRCVRTGHDSAEVAFMVSKDYQGQGIARRLLTCSWNRRALTASRGSRRTCSARIARCSPSSSAAAFPSGESATAPWCT